MDQPPLPRSFLKAAASFGCALAAFATVANAPDDAASVDGEPPWPKEWFEAPAKASDRDVA